MDRNPNHWLSAFLLPLFALAFVSSQPLALPAQGARSRATQAVEAAVQAELAANATDKSNWTYRDHDTVPGRDTVWQTVETPDGSLKRALALHGQPLTASDRDKESERIERFVHDPSAQAKQRKEGEHDDEQAAAMLKMLPHAFLWTITSETPELLTLNYRPNLSFNPPDMQARVMSVMGGEMIIAKNGNRIRTLRGALTTDVKIGYGLLGKLQQGGTFQVERREVAPGRWQITETHVHIGGHALLFKTIGQQEDEVKTEWKPSPAKNLQEAEEFLRTVK